MSEPLRAKLLRVGRVQPSIRGQERDTRTRRGEIDHPGNECDRKVPRCAGGGKRRAIGRRETWWYGSPTQIRRVRDQVRESALFEVPQQKILVDDPSCRQPARVVFLKAGASQRGGHRLSRVTTGNRV